MAFKLIKAAVIVIALILYVAIIICVISIGNRRNEKDSRLLCLQRDFEKRTPYQKNRDVLMRLQGVVSMAGPNDTIYVTPYIDFNIEGYTLIGNGSLIDFDYEKAGPNGIRLVRGY